MSFPPIGIIAEFDIVSPLLNHVFIDFHAVLQRFIANETHFQMLSIFCVEFVVMFHPRFRHDIQTTAAVFYLTSSGRSVGSSLYSRKAGVSGFGCHRLERPASPRRISAVTRSFQTTPLRPFCFPVPTKTLSYDSCVTITMLLCLW